MKKELDDIYTKIELEANDELQLLTDIGPELFPLQDLIQIKYKLEKKHIDYKSQYKRNLIIGAVAPAFLALALLCLATDMNILAGLLFILTPIPLLSLFYSVYMLRQNYGNKSDYENLIQLIDSEIIVRNYTKRKQL